ncbi:hypothetical protein ACLI4Z_16350 [Natrialbaceae archaeon A-arb3/5]
MTVRAAFGDGWTALRNNPVLLAAGFALALVGQLSTIGELSDSVAVDTLASVGFFLAFPFVMGGFLGIALEAVRESDPSFGTFLRAGRTYYVRMLLATILFGLIAIAVMFGTFPLAIVGGGAWVFGIDALGESAALALAILFVGSYLLVLLVVLMFVQFYDTAIVVEDNGATSSLSRSIRVVRSNLRSVLAFSFLWLVLLNTVLMPEVLFGSVRSDAVIAQLLPVDIGFDPLFVVPISVAVTTVVGAYLYTVYTAFYVRIAADTDDSSDEPEPTPAG